MTFCWKYNTISLTNEGGVFNEYRRSNKKRTEKKHLTQEKLAKQLNMSRNYLSDIENGRYNPSIKLLEKIVEVLECEIKVERKN